MYYFGFICQINLLNWTELLQKMIHTVFLCIIDGRPHSLYVSTRAKNVAWRYQVQIPVGPDICHRGCAYAVLQTAQRYGVYSAVYGTVHYKKNL